VLSIGRVSENGMREFCRNDLKGIGSPDPKRRSIITAIILVVFGPLLEWMWSDWFLQASR
jgi:hypothetical protein